MKVRKVNDNALKGGNVWQGEAQLNCSVFNVMFFYIKMALMNVLSHDIAVYSKVCVLA